MRIIAIIPARMGSTRFPGKPLAKINKIPMIEHVYKNVSKSKLIKDVYVATCDKEISNHLDKIQANYVMTSKKHKRASDRSLEALKILEKKNKKKYHIVVMVQGDEPMVNSKMIDQALKPMIKDKSILVLNLMSKINNKEDFKDPNFIKVVHDKNNNALYFSRSAIPHQKFKKDSKIKKQVCIIPFRRDFLFKYYSMHETNLEIIESIDMLRILENGYKVKLVETKYFTHAVDTKRDLLKVEKFLRLKKS
jgi:3-deoxy-manno-octulosonate cytidylyltransferase (CMP-KDO synthetase)